MKTFGEVITALEKEGVDVREIYWMDGGADIDLVILVDGKRYTVSSITFTPRRTGVDGEILVDTKEEEVV